MGRLASWAQGCTSFQQGGRVMFNNNEDIGSIEYVLRFALHVINEYELETEKSGENWVLGKSIEEEINNIRKTPFTPHHVLLQDKMEIKEGDEVICEGRDETQGKMYWVGISRLLIGGEFVAEHIRPIRRHLTTMEEVQAFWKEAKECGV